MKTFILILMKKIKLALTFFLFGFATLFSSPQAAFAKAHCFCKAMVNYNEVHKYSNVAEYGTQYGHDADCIERCQKIAGGVPLSQWCAWHPGSGNWGFKWAVGGSAYGYLNVAHSQGIHYTCPATGLTYTVNTIIIAIGQSYNSGVPLHSGGAVTSYGVSPALPPGLGLKGTTGVISGTPSAVKAASNYTVTAWGPGGSTSRVVNITVTLPSLPYVHYKSNPVIYYKGVAIAPNNPNPSGRGDGASSWSVSPALPAGLVFNTATGFITGTPAAVQAAANYTVTGSNAGGSTTQAVSIQVKSNVIGTGGTYNSPK